MNTTPVVKDLVLVGGGHSHIIVLKRLGMDRMPGVRVTVIARDVDTPYSGMLPGYIAGHYTLDEIHIDLAPLSRFVGARLYHDEVVGLDLAERRVRCRDHPPVPFDVLSIDIGITPILSVPGAAAHATAVKPISTLAGRWEQLKRRVLQSERPLRIGMVGAGAAGVEVTLAMQYALGRLLEARGLGERAPEFHLFSAAPEILPTHNPRVRRAFLRVVSERGVQLHTRARITHVRPDGVETASGDRIAIDEVVWATQAGAQSWPREAGLDVDDAGFIRVDDALQSTSHPGVFAAGDITASVNHPREKAGVFAVRQGPPLVANLRRALAGESLEAFTPQRKFLSLVSTGDKYAVASRGGWSFEGRWVWDWKDWIDRRFMTKFSELPEMPVDDEDAGALSRLAPPDTVRELSAAAMRCGGCGSKVGATVLDRVLTRLAPIPAADVVIGLDTPDDAAVERIPPGKVAVRTVDAFRAIVDDPYVFGQIASNHALGDLYAMGAEPRTALAIATIPFGIEAKMESLLDDLLSGAVKLLNREETALVGGHTTEGPELVFGLALSGVADPDALLRKSGMRVGDRLVLTKPLGTGTLFAAHMRLRARARWLDAAVASMLCSSRAAADCVRRHGATACTDVTGFGLLGHLTEMTKASGVDARLTLSALPLLDGARETIAAGLLSSLQPQNVRLRRAIGNLDDVAADPLYPVVFDPQTAGGLLASVPAAQADACVVELRELGYEGAAIVGSVEASSDRDAPIWIER